MKNAGLICAILSILGGVCELASWIIDNKSSNERRLTDGTK